MMRGENPPGQGWDEADMVGHVPLFRLQGPILHRRTPAFSKTRSGWSEPCSGRIQGIETPKALGRLRSRGSLRALPAVACLCHRESVALPSSRRTAPRTPGFPERAVGCTDRLMLWRRCPPPRVPRPLVHQGTTRPAATPWWTERASGARRRPGDASTAAKRGAQRAAAVRAPRGLSVTSTHCTGYSERRQRC